MTVGQWLGVIVGVYLVVGVVWACVVSWLSRGDGASEGEQVIMFAGLTVLWPVAAAVVVPAVVRQGWVWAVERVAVRDVDKDS